MQWARQWRGRIRLPFVLCCALLWALLTAASPTYAQEFRATVLSFSGAAAWKAAPSDPWQPVTLGLRLKGTASLTTGADGFVRGVQANGRPMEIPESTEGALDTLLAGGTTGKTNVLAALNDVFAGPVPEHKPTGEVVEEGAETATPRGRRPREDWFSPVKQERLTWDEAEKLMYVAARSTDRPVQNRAVALLARVAQAFPDDVGLQALSRQAIAAWGTAGAVEVIHDKSDGKPMPSGTVLHRNDRTRVRYKADTETFPVVVRLTLNSAGAVASRPLWKATQESPLPVAGADRLDLPGRVSWFPVRKGEKAQAVVGWACVAPTREDAVAAAVNAAEQQVAAGALDVSRLPAVPYCPQVSGAYFPVEWP